VTLLFFRWHFYSSGDIFFHDGDHLILVQNEQHKKRLLGVEMNVQMWSCLSGASTSTTLVLYHLYQFGTPRDPWHAGRIRQFDSLASWPWHIWNFRPICLELTKTSAQPCFINKRMPDGRAVKWRENFLSLHSFFNNFEANWVVRDMKNQFDKLAPWAVTRLKFRAGTWVRDAWLTNWFKWYSMSHVATCLETGRLQVVLSQWLVKVNLAYYVAEINVSLFIY
jgi:hypothetical protein